MPLRIRSSGRNAPCRQRRLHRNLRSTDARSRGTEAAPRLPWPDVSVLLGGAGILTVVGIVQLIRGAHHISAWFWLFLAALLVAVARGAHARERLEAERLAQSRSRCQGVGRTAGRWLNQPTFRLAFALTEVGTAGKRRTAQSPRAGRPTGPRDDRGATRRHVAA